ncbi:unnamed protein product, partial [Meganyctiphanes norvegica]
MPKMDIRMKMLILLVTWLCQTLLLSSSALAQGKLPCQFPFIYKNITYSSCTTVDDPQDKRWCSTKTDNQNNHVSGGGHYRECSKEENLQLRQASSGNCLTHLDKEIGDCITIQECPLMNAILENVRAGDNSGFPILRGYVCGDTSTKPLKVCCPRTSTTSRTPLCLSASSTSTTTMSTRSTNDKCGVSLNTDKIVGGENAQLGSWPWMVIFRARTIHPVNGIVGDISLWICGGVLITEQFVLSAAHCFPDKLIEFVRIGEFDLKQNPDLGRGLIAPDPQNIDVECVIMHPEFGKPCRRCNDIALVKLAKPAKFHEIFVQPICLPSIPEKEVGFSIEEFQTKTGFVTGWGLTDAKDLLTVKGSDVLQQVNLNIVDRDFCLKRKTAYPNPNMIMCAGEGDGKDSCRADSGGPLMLPSLDGLRYYIVGITSFGATVCGSEASQTVFTSVHYYKDWINQNMIAHA